MQKYSPLDKMQRNGNSNLHNGSFSRLLHFAQISAFSPLTAFALYRVATRDTQRRIVRSGVKKKSERRENRRNGFRRFSAKRRP